MGASINDDNKTNDSNRNNDCDINSKISLEASLYQIGDYLHKPKKLIKNSTRRTNISQGERERNPRRITE